VPEELERAVSILSDRAYSFASHTNMDVLSVFTLGVDITARNVDTRFLATLADPDREQTRELKDLATRYGMPELAEGEAELHALFLQMWVEQGGRRNAKGADVQAFGWANVPTDHPVFVKYAGLDAIAARRLAPLLTAATQDPMRLIEIDQWLHVRANRIQIRGHRLDRDAAVALNDETLTAWTQAKTEAEEIAGVNVNGPKVIDWFGEHGVDWDEWPGARSQKTGVPSLSKDNLALVRDFPLDGDGAKVLDLMLTQQAHADLKTKTNEVLRRAVYHGPGNWRLHPLLNPVGAGTTARMSSSAPNMQNFSKKDPRMRGLFLPDLGHVLATIDFAQIELRVVAALAREDAMIETIKAGGDLHQLTVDELAQAGVTITRDTAKIVNFLIVYGGGPYALHTQTGIPFEECRVIINAWRERYGSISALAKWLAYEHDAIRTISNRRLPVTRVKGSGERAGDLRTYANINYAVQSAARELLVDAWRRFDEDHGHGDLVWWPIHDELVLQIPEGKVDRVLADAKASMTMDFRGVPIEADGIVLLDEDGTSRWMTGKRAEAIQKARTA
jgi:DNA polymerase-1